MKKKMDWEEVYDYIYKELSIRDTMNILLKLTSWYLRIKNDLDYIEAKEVVDKYIERIGKE